MKKILSEIIWPNAKIDNLTVYKMRLFKLEKFTNPYFKVEKVDFIIFDE